MEWLYDLVGRYGDTITWWQMSVRALGGRMRDDNLRRTGISERDLREQVRSSLNTEDLDTLDEAYLERGGDVSFGRR
jgi:hypothetical protein